MNTRSLPGFITISRILLGVVAASAMYGDTTFTFQNGASGYSGAQDFSINTQYAQYNGGNGIQWSGDPELGCYTTTGSGSYTVRYLVKFGGLTVPAGSTVVSATLAIGVDWWESGSGNITGFYLKNSWNAAANNIGWLHRDDSGHDWAGPGASGAGVDTVAGKSFQVPPLRPVGAQVVTIPLDVSVVQSWINSASANQGIMLVNNNPGEIARPVSTVGTQRMRPKLTIVISSAGSPVQVTVAPTSVTLSPGGVQTFAAMVTGSSNTGVTWAATGGTITAGGVYTAGSTPGNFSATATSVADTTKSASAAITIQPAPVVSVAISPTSATLQTGQTQQFTATVTGTSNTGVTWSATGGTISTSGLFTAGSTTGTNFTVKATSVADTTKSATAAVTIQPAPVVSVVIAPTSKTLQVGQTQQFTATVTGSSNTAVTWTATGGTISTSGSYTAGSTVGSNFTVTATSMADTTKSASAAVTIQPIPVVSVAVSPTSVTVQTGQTQQFTATVTGTSNTAVTWSATGGTISTSGLFAAGSAAGSNFTVTATSVADTTKSAVASVTIQAAPAVSVSISPTSATLQPARTQQFTATVTGTSNTGVTWTATGGAISTSGLYTAGSTTGNFSVTATSVADTTKSASAPVQITTTTTSLPPIPRQFDGPYIVVQSPVSGMHFAAPGTIRIYADPFDPNANDPDAVTVNYLLNGQSVGTFTGSGSRNGYFPFTATNLAAGAYSITTQITTGGRTITSAPVTVFVDPPAASSGPVFNLTGDVVLSSSQTQNYAGTASNHCTINGNGFQIRSASGFTGTLNISFCDIRNLGTATNPGINVTTGGSGSIQLIGNVWETFGTVSVAANDTAQLVVRNNEFRENTLVPATNLPIAYANETLPVLDLSGNSSTQKFFQGNNVGLSTVLFENTRNWLIGGNTDAESNVLMGVRCGFTVTGSTGMVLRGNYSQHNYPHRMSQGDNFQLEGDGFLVEHNIIRDSSWPVRGMGGELRYNLIDSSATLDQVIQGPLSNTNMHHNIITYTVSQGFYAPGSGVRVMYGVDNVQFNNNTFDGSGPFMGFAGAPIRVFSDTFIGSLRNSVFYNFAGLAGEPMLAGDQGESTNPPLARLRYADYNDFYNPDAPNQTNYGLGVVGRTAGAAGYGQHDLGGFNGHANPKFSAPTALPFPFAPQDIWNRVKKVSDVLSTYRAMYTPATGSPLINAGDPQDGSPNIGAVGNGEAVDQFGRFGSGGSTPAAPVIASFTASPSGVVAGQSVTLSWSVTGATSLSIAPGVGTVTGTSVTVTPSATTTYTLTATNAGGSASGTATVSVTSAPTLAVSVTPASATLAAGGTQQFTATVAGASNTAVTWTATGGTISTTGLFTAGAIAGSFQVKATSVQDTTKSGTATVTINAAPVVSVSVSPNPASLFTGGAQQFTATVTGASNTAVTWTATGGTISTTGLYTAGATAGSFQVTATSVADTTKSGSATVTVSTPPSSGSHPRIILDSTMLSTLRTRVANHTPEWTRLKGACDNLASIATVIGPEAPDPGGQVISEGYQGSDYIEAIWELGLCYQSTLTSDATSATKYANKGVQILMVMSDPANQNLDIGGGKTQPIWERDDGYGIRNFGVAMSIGYDWFHDRMTSTQLSQIRTALNGWINGVETSDKDAFEFQPSVAVTGNYYAGYYATKCYAALAVQGDDPIGDTWWNDWYNHQHLQRVQPYYTNNYAGGGWTEGFAQYGILASRNMSMPALAVKSAKGIDLLHGTQPYVFPLDQPRYLMSLTWPTRDIIDDRGELYDTGDALMWPGTASVDIYRFYAGFLTMVGDPLAPAMHKYAKDVQAALQAIGDGLGGTTDWMDFLFWDPNASDADYTATTPLSYLAAGQGEVGARADWSNAATYMSFVAGPFVAMAGHESYDKGSPEFLRNRNPLLVNPRAWISHEPDGSAGWTLAYNDNFGNNSLDPTFGNRVLNNTFQVRHIVNGAPVPYYGEDNSTRDDGARTRISRFEDRGSYVLAVGQNLEDMYHPLNDICQGVSPINSWSRQIVYFRPSQFVVYDRTNICNVTLDQYMAFHFPANPAEVAAPASGTHRFDVINGSFAGSMTVVMPAVQSTITDRLSSDINTWNKMWRVELRPMGTANAVHQWMTVFDLAPTAPQVAAATPLTVTGAAAVGTLLASSAGNNVMIAGTAPVGTAISGAISYTVPAAQTRHVVTDLTPSTGYTISVMVSGSNHVITVAPGGSTQSSANGSLSFAVTAGGTLQ